MKTWQPKYTLNMIEPRWLRRVAVALFAVAIVATFVVLGIIAVVIDVAVGIVNDVRATWDECRECVTDLFGSLANAWRKP